jgi:threonine dehydratase
MVDLGSVREARDRIAATVHRTPLVGSRYLDARTGGTIRLKLESFQKTGSFKPRGALHRLLVMPERDRRRGLVTVSAGNHAQAAAFVCAARAIPCAVVMPSSAPPVKIEAVRDYGAEVVLHDDMRTLFERCEEVRAARDATFLHPFDDPAVVAGHGTVGLEIVEDFPDVDTIVCGVGGGGLIAGVAVAARGLRPDLRVIGVEPEGAPTMSRALERGSPVRLEAIRTIADGLSAPFAGELNLAIVRDRVERMVRVTDAEIVDAIRVLMTRCKLVAEPAGAAALGAVLAGRIDVRGRRVAVIVSGGNLDLDRLPSWIESVSPR